MRLWISSYGYPVTGRTLWEDRHTYTSLSTLVDKPTRSKAGWHRVVESSRSLLVRREGEKIVVYHNAYTPEPAVTYHADGSMDVHGSELRPYRPRLFACSWHLGKLVGMSFVRAGVNQTALVRADRIGTPRNATPGWVIVDKDDISKEPRFPHSGELRLDAEGRQIGERPAWISGAAFPTEEVRKEYLDFRKKTAEHICLTVRLLGEDKAGMNYSYLHSEGVAQRLIAGDITPVLQSVLRGAEHVEHNEWLARHPDDRWCARRDRPVITPAHIRTAAFNVLSRQGIANELRRHFGAIDVTR